MKRRLNANTWILIGLCGILLLVGADAAVRLFAGASGASSEPGAAPPAEDSHLMAGDQAPDFTLPDRSGRPHKLSELVHRDTVLCFTCGCANCLDVQTYLGILLKKMGARAPSVVTVTTMPKDREDAWRRDTRLKETLLYEPKDGPVMAQYQGHPCPRIYRLKPDRQIWWIGPSPNQVPSMRELGDAMAANLGFPRSRPGNAAPPWTARPASAPGQKTKPPSNPTAPRARE